MVEVFKERKALVLQYDAGDYVGPVNIRCESDSDVSESNLVSNPGFAAVSFPLEYSGSFHASVLDADGNVLDEGDVSI